jgi:uncharacterized protein DUF6799
MESKEDMVVMKSGRMMVVRFGEMKPMDMVMTLSNGTKVAMDGTITMPDGTSRRLMDGEAITLDGEMTTLEDMKGGDAMEGDLGNRMKDV